MPKDKIQYFGAELSAARLCLKCGYIGQLKRGVRRCPECRAPFPKRSKEYDKAVMSALSKHSGSSTIIQEQSSGLS